MERANRIADDDLDERRERREEVREERYEERSKVREEVYDDREDFRDEAWDDVEDWHDDHWHRTSTSLVFVGTSCPDDTVRKGGVTYYLCDGAWYTRAYEAGELVYIPSGGP